jgi:hypothetical protein
VLAGQGPAVEAAARFALLCQSASRPPPPPTSATTALLQAFHRPPSFRFVCVGCTHVSWASWISQGPACSSQWRRITDALPTTHVGSRQLSRSTKWGVCLSSLQLTAAESGAISRICHSPQFGVYVRGFTSCRGPRGPHHQPPAHQVLGAGGWGLRSGLGCPYGPRWCLGGCLGCPVLNLVYKWYYQQLATSNYIAKDAHHCAHAHAHCVLRAACNMQHCTVHRQSGTGVACQATAWALGLVCCLCLLLVGWLCGFFMFSAQVLRVRRALQASNAICNMQYVFAMENGKGKGLRDASGTTNWFSGSCSYVQMHSDRIVAACQ